LIPTACGDCLIRLDATEVTVNSPCITQQKQE